MGGPVLAATLAVALAVTATHARADAPSDIGKRLLEEYVQPATTRFSDAADAMTDAVETFCRAPDAEAQGVVRERFGTLVGNAFRVLILRFGPLVADNRFERIFFWPDPRGTTLRQVQGLIAGADPAAVDPDLLAAKSVAVQGLPALEYALYGAGHEELLQNTDTGRTRCAYALAVSARIAKTAGEVSAAWAADSPYARDFSRPGPDNANYRTDAEVAAEAIKAMATGLSFLSGAIVRPFLGEDPAKANYRRAPFWRSGQTIPAIRSSLTGVRDVYGAAGFAEALDDSERWIDGSLAFEFRNALAALDSLGLPVEDIVTAGPDRESLGYAVIAIDSLHTTTETVLARAAGVAMGFNALDGD